MSGVLGRGERNIGITSPHKRFYSKEMLLYAAYKQRDRQTNMWFDLNNYLHSYLHTKCCKIQST